MTINKNSVRPNPSGESPIIHPSAYIDPTAQIIGNVRIGAKVYVGPYAVIRADEVDADGNGSLVEIADETNVQDGVIIHTLGGTKVAVGKRCSLAHGCVVHGPCSLGDECFIGFRSVVYKSSLGNNCFINAASVVQGIDLPEESAVPPAIAITTEEDANNKTQKTADPEKQFAQKVVNANLKLVEGYRK